MLAQLLTLAWTWDGPLDDSGTAVAAGDVDGDGLDEVLVAADGGYGVYGMAFLFEGTPGGPTQAPEWAVATAGPVTAVAFGDIDGDGREEVIIGASDPGTAGDAGTVLVYTENALRTSTVPSWSFASTTPGAAAGRSVAAADIDGDGYADLIVGAPGLDLLWLFRGGPLGLPDAPDVELTGAGHSGLGEWVATVGDLDGDAAEEVVAALPDLDTAWLLWGAEAGWGEPVALEGSPAAPEVHSFGLGGVVGGDLNGDGSPDLALGEPTGADDRGRVHVWYGSALAPSLGLKGAASLILEGASPSIQLGGSLASLGDVNRDGFDDLAVGAGVENAVGASEFRVYLGSAVGLARLPAASYSLLTHDVNLAASSDMDGDGQPELLVGRPLGATGGADAYRASCEPGTIDSDGDGLADGCDLCFGHNPSGDLDADGLCAQSADGRSLDCDDSDPNRAPGFAELCDGIDNGCRGWLLESEADPDDDGVMSCAGDCDDLDPAVYPGAPEPCGEVDCDPFTVPRGECGGGKPSSKGPSRGCVNVPSSPPSVFLLPWLIALMWPGGVARRSRW